MSKPGYDEMEAILSKLQAHREVQEMKRYVQHGQVSTYEHCERVARLSYAIDRRLGLHADLRVLLAGAMLHDFYLYDWHSEDDGAHRLHGFRHARAAWANARCHFGIDDRTGQVILSHMWPLNLSRLPRSREAWIVCVADKWASLQETLFMRRKKG